MMKHLPVHFISNHLTNRTIVSFHSAWDEYDDDDDDNGGGGGGGSGGRDDGSSSSNDGGGEDEAI